MLLGVTALLLPLVLIRIKDIARPALLLMIFTAVYALSSWLGTNQSQGYVHTTALLCTGTAFITFAVYGSAILQFASVRALIIIIVLTNVVAISTANFTMNAAGATLLYVVAFGYLVLMRRQESNGGLIATLFFLSGMAIALSFEVRSLIVDSVLFIVAFYCATRLPKRAYWIGGITVSASVILGTIWFFLNIERSTFIAEASVRIREWTGARVESGRDVLWPSILHAVSETPIFGLGAGALPRDVLTTQLSAHNYYLQVYMQVGLLGIGLLVAFLLSAWKRLSTATTGAGRFGSALFLLFLVHNGTEVLMFQNNTLIGVPAWCAIGLALSLDTAAASSESTPNELHKLENSRARSWH
ncbi:O-antigen ligase family protein [Mycolicibacterium diernhoferi]|uniref:O-antigen ligase domain-containing protein n=1 Tax=Mycolicibacterium diernhoferi TaxID=1801 RepID=A0A1T3WMN3_9MYCO|nr:O-antigen ligase family protein [Mycolicibacterium diernhoferi]OPE55381.1 hypothetical protein BV510_05385 [Mycolicibacterium diernhoferi]PEG52245.1 O-antigen ligase domain-containing protein [Mycolicibacterium diernhoferi]